MSGIMDIFRTVTGTQPQQQPQNNQQGGQPGNPGNLPSQQPTMIANGSQDGQVPGGNGAPQSAEVSPLKEFEKLWEPVTLPSGAVPDSPIKFSIDPTKVNQSAKAIDFTKMVTPALLEKINAGGADATQAMLQAMNEMAQVVFAQSMMANTRVTENALELGYQRTQKQLPDTIRKQTIGNALREDNPLFSNPATAPMLQLLEQQFVAKYPTASAAEIKDNARAFLVQFASEASKLAPQTADKSAPKYVETDWSKEPV